MQVLVLPLRLFLYRVYNVDKQCTWRVWRACACACAASLTRASPVLPRA
jgi:hypothetical protein